MIDPRTATPAEIDTELVALELAAAHWQAILNASIEDPRRAQQADDASAALADLAVKTAPLHAAYRERRWARWYFVPGGHLHAEGECSTLFQSTERILTPAVSGATPAEAVEKFGWHVCSVCYQDAPTHPAFRTPGSHANAQADAEGWCLNKTPKTGSVNSRYRTLFGRCGDCDATGINITSLGNLVKHKHARRAADAARKGRIEDPKLIGTPTGEELRVDGDTIRTVRSAEIAYVSHMDWAGWGSDPTFVAEHQAHAQVIAAALAAKSGETVDQVVERLAPKVARKLAQYQR